jgi:hypothetical protein
MTTKRDIETCRSCYFFQPVENDKGECRRNPPSAIVMPMPIATEEKENAVHILKPNFPGGRGRQMTAAPENPRFGPVGYWPPTSKNLWCGEWKGEE